MNVVKGRLKRLLSWRLWAVLLGVTAVGAGIYLGVNEWRDSDSSGGAGQTQLVPVTRGSLVNDVSVTGTLAYTTRENVAFRQQGFVSDIEVAEGDWVSAGDPLARLDAETMANLDRAVAQARVEVRDAEEALEGALSPYTAAQIAGTELDVAMARLSLQEANEELADHGVVSSELLAEARLAVVSAQLVLDDAIDNRSNLLAPSFQEVARAQSQVTAARIALQNSQDELEELLNPDETDVAEAQAAVTRAQIELEDAREALDAITEVTALELAMARTAVTDAELEFIASRQAIHELETWSVANDIPILQDSIFAAQESLLQAKADLQEAKRNADEAIKAIADQLETARDNYIRLFESWLGIDMALFSGNSPDVVLAELEIDLAYVYSDVHIEELQLQYEQGSMENSPSTPWNEVVVHSQAALHPGRVMVDCGNQVAGPGLACVMEELTGAYNAVEREAANLRMPGRSRPRLLAGLKKRKPRPRNTWNGPTGTWTLISRRCPNPSRRFQRSRAEWRRWD